MNITLDVFNALIDSRPGASPVFELIAALEHWPLSGEELFGAWDRQHKRLQLECQRWEPFAALGRRALAQVMDERQLTSDLEQRAPLGHQLGDRPCRRFGPLLPTSGDVEADGLDRVVEGHRRYFTPAPGRSG